MWTIKSDGSVGLAVGVALGGSRWKVDTGSKKYNLYFAGAGAGLSIEFDSSAKFKLPPTGELFFSHLLYNYPDDARERLLPGPGWIVDFGFGKALVFSQNQCEPVTGVIQLGVELPLLAAMAHEKPDSIYSSSQKAFAFIPTGDVKAGVKALWGQWLQVPEFLT